SEELNKLIEKKINENKTNIKPIIKVEISGKLKEGFKSIDLNLQDISSTEKDLAIIEVSKSGIEETKSDQAEELRSGMVENMSIHDFGVSVFLEKLSSNKYELKANPSILFDILSSEEKKDVVVKKALDEVLKEKG
ncbi:MAG: hypothetical protein ACP5M9_03460, partial [Candidatus Micrarchaeia archaeon]